MTTKATQIWSPPSPTLTVATDLPTPDEYEVRVYDNGHGRRLVAAVEIVSPSNKDRPEHRRAFVARCATLLHARVCVAIVDLVTTRSTNLGSALMEFLGQPDPFLDDGPPPALCHVQPLDEEGRRQRPGNLGRSPGDRPTPDDVAALDRRELLGAARTGADL